MRGLSFSNPVPYDDLPPGNGCTDLPSDFDGFVLTDGAFNMRFSDGSLLFGKAADGGYVCFDPPKAFAPYDLAGGTGRFEGATGYIQYDIDTHPFGSTAVVPETGSATGEVILP